MLVECRIEEKRMKSLSVLMVILVLHIVNSNCVKLHRNKRFLSALWPSSPQSANKQENEVVYLHLSPEYVEMMHQELQARADQLPPSNPPVRFVKPTKMMSLAPTKTSIQSPPVSHLPKIIMRPLAKPEPGLKLSHEQALPDLHKTHRFVTPTPFPKASTPKPQTSVYSHQQALPIKRISDTNIISAPILTIKTADISEFYYTKEFNDLLTEFKLKVDRNKLPDIKDVMTILGTEDAKETLEAIREVANTDEGMELITSYLEGSDRVEDDEFYRFDEDVGAGEIHVSGNDYQQNYIQPFENGILQSDDASQYNFSPIEEPVTTAPESWWRRPFSFSWLGFGSSAQSTKVDSIKKDVEILAKVVKQPEGFGAGMNYARNFLTPANRETVKIDPPMRVASEILTEAIEQPSTMPTVQMSEEQFEKMVKELHLTPIYPRTTTPATLTTTENSFSVFANPIVIAEEQEIQIPDPQIPQKVNNPVPPQLSEYENRRNFESISEPMRISPIESRTGKVFKVHPDEVHRETETLLKSYNGEMRN